MSRRSRWVVVLLSGLVLLVVGGVILCRDIARARASKLDDLRKSCHYQAIVFEEFVEHSIVRDQRETLEALARFLIAGGGLYVDVVFQSESLFHGRDEGFDIEPLLAVDSELPLQTVIEDLAGGDVEVRTPVIFDGIPDRAYGMIRIGFSGDYAAGQVRAHAWKVTGIGLGAWAVAVLAVALGVWGFTRPRGDDTDASSASTILFCGTLEVDTTACCAKLGGISLDLTPKLYDLLLAFARNPGSLLSDQDLLDAVWADSTYAASPDVKQHIYLLRRRIKAAHPDPKSVIVNVKGFGYRLDPPGDEDGLSDG